MGENTPRKIDVRIIVATNENFRQLSITTRASRSEANHSRHRHSSLSLPLKLSHLPFCQGLPGSIKIGLMPLVSNQ